jgi:hypothetical protein
MNLVNEDGSLTDEAIVISKRFYDQINDFIKDLHNSCPPSELYNLEAILQSEIHCQCAENRISLRSKNRTP